MKKKISTIVIILLVLSMVPFKTTVVPEWKLRIIDENGNPYKGLMVIQHCQDATLEYNCDGLETNPYTDQDGYVVFPKRTVQMSLTIRVLATMVSLLRHLITPHSSLGIRVSISASGSFGYQVLEYNPNEPLPEKFVLRTTLD